MASAASLPIIDISPYLGCHFQYPLSAEQLACSQSIHNACISHGFFYITGLGLSQSDLASVLSLAKQFFDLPRGRKEHLSIASSINGSDGARGWQRLNENITGGQADHHEGLDFYKVVKETTDVPLHGRNQWPQEVNVQGFKSTFERWFELMLPIGKALVLATGVGLRMEQNELNQLSSLVDDSFWVARIIGYPKLPADHAGVSCGAHKE